MTSQQEFIDQAAGIATCAMLGAGTARMAQFAIGSAVTGQVWGVVGFGAGTAAFAALALGYGCYHNPDDPYPDAPPDTEPPDCCQISTLGGQLWATATFNPDGVPITTAYDCKQILRTYPVWVPNADPPYNQSYCDYINGAGQKATNSVAWSDEDTTWCIRLTQGESDCKQCCQQNNDGGLMYEDIPGQPVQELDINVTKILGTSADGQGNPVINYYKTGSSTVYQKAISGNGRVCISPTWDGTCSPWSPGPPGVPVPPSPPIPFTDDEGCNWTIEVVDTYIGASGQPSVKYTATSDDPETCGGPFTWWQHPGGGGDPVNPDPPGPGPTPTPDPDPPTPTPDPDPPTPTPTPAPTVPPQPLDCCTQLLVAINNVYAKAEANEKRLMKLESELLLKLLPNGPAQKFIAPCDFDEDDKPLEVDYQMLGGQGVMGSLAAAIQNQDKGLRLLQQHLEWKTPVCGQKEESRGTFARTLHFVSDTYTDGGKRYQDKQFKYHSNKEADHVALVEHWKNFTWKTGSVIVRHRGSAMGRIEVWAETMEEGLRVLNYASVEAGVDLSKKGSFESATVSSERYGQSRLVRIKCVKGVLAITSRDDSNGYPDGG